MAPLLDLNRKWRLCLRRVIELVPCPMAIAQVIKGVVRRLVFWLGWQSLLVRQLFQVPQY